MRLMIPIRAWTMTMCFSRGADARRPKAGQGPRRAAGRDGRRRTRAARGTLASIPERGHAVVDAEAARRVELRHQAAVRDRRRVADAERPARRRSPGRRTRSGPRAMKSPPTRSSPPSALSLRVVVRFCSGWMPALTISASAAGRARRSRSAGRTAASGNRSLEVLEDRQRLDEQDRAAVRALVLDLERRHLRHRVQVAVPGVWELAPRPADDVDGDVLVGELLEPERDPDPVARRRAAPVVVEHAASRATAGGAITRLIGSRRTAAPVGSSTARSRSVSPTFMNGVDGLPCSMVSIIRRSARHEMPRARSALDTVPLPRMVPATKPAGPGDVGDQIVKREVHLRPGVAVADRARRCRWSAREVQRGRRARRRARRA
jgi:hypothetical protein